MDDFHNINAIKTPTKRILTNAVHMATLLLDIQSSVPAAPRPVEPANIHQCVMVSQGGGTPKVCRGGILSDAVVNEMRGFWPHYSECFSLENFPRPYKGIDLCRMQQSTKELW